MVQVRSIDIGDIPPKQLSGIHSSPEYAEVRSLDVGGAIAFPCRWRHSGQGGSQCSAVMNVNTIARRNNWKVRATCTGEKTGEVMVGRIL
jgi:hypothetical protein